MPNPDPIEAVLRKQVEQRNMADQEQQQTRRYSFVTTSLSELFSWYSVKGAGLISAVSTAYAASSDLQRLIPATTYGSIMAIAGLVLIIVRNIKQSGDQKS